MSKTKAALESLSDKSGTERGQKKKGHQALKDGKGGEIMPPTRRGKVGPALEPSAEEK